MNNTLKTKLLKRADELLNLSAELIQYISQNPNAWVPRVGEWFTATESLITKISGEDSVHYRNFRSYVNSPQLVLSGKIAECAGVLKALRDEMEQGLIGEIENLAREEVFIDLLERARYYLETGDKDSAAFLGGAVLEDNLRKIAKKHNIPVKDSDDISSLNTKLADARVYPRSTQKQIQAWKAIRDPADHGKFGQHTANNVKYMLEGVQNFLTEHIG